MSARRIFPLAYKKQVVAFAAEHGLNHAERTFDVSGSLICRWRRVLASRADAAREVALTQECVYLWRHLRDAGGWWSVQELQAHWQPTFAPAWLHSTLRMLAHHGFVAKRLHIAGGVPVYGVTAACEPLPGESLEPQECAPC